MKRFFLFLIITLICLSCTIENHFLPVINGKLCYSDTTIVKENVSVKLTNLCFQGYVYEPFTNVEITNRSNQHLSLNTEKFVLVINDDTTTTNKNLIKNINLEPNEKINLELMYTNADLHRYYNFEKKIKVKVKLLLNNIKLNNKVVSFPEIFFVPEDSTEYKNHTFLTN